MIDWKKFKDYKEYKAHSGGILPFKWEFDYLLKEENKNDLLKIQAIIEALASPHQIIGIRTMGWEIVKDFDNAIPFPFEDDNTPSYKMGECSYVIFDDVITTGNSIKEVINNHFHHPIFIVCIVNRSPFGSIFGKTIYEVKKILKGK